MEEEEFELKEALKELKKKELERRKQASNDRNTGNDEDAYKPSAIYISNLPKQSNLENELIYEFSKFGKIKKDQDGNVKCKVYKDDDGEMKGDALIVYARHESLPIAIQMMDGYEFEGAKIKVEVATFKNEKKRKYDNLTADQESQSSSGARKTLRKNDTVEELASHLNDSDDESQKRARTIILANCIDLYDDLDGEELVEELNEIRLDLLDGCKATGPVESIQLNARQGKATAIFEKERDAQECCRKMNKRFFGGRELAVFMLNEENVSQSSDSDEEFLEELLEDDVVEL